MTASPANGDPLSRRTLVRSSAMLGAALLAGNLAGYLLAIIGSHRLHPDEYGLFGALLAVLLIGGIPALALQAVVARRTAAERLPLHRALRDGSLTGAVSVVVGVAAWPGLTAFLHVDHHGVAILFAVAGLFPLNILGACQGHLQGAETFGRLSWLVLVVGFGRLLGGVVPLVAGSGPTAVMAGVAVATALTALVGLRMTATVATPTPTPSTEAPSLPREATAPELVRATLSMGSLLLLASLDLLLARHVLPAGQAGRYAAGNVVAKVAFWLPQAVSLTALPRLSRGADRARALRDAAVLTAAIAAIDIAVTAVAGGFLVRLTFGAGYQSIGGVAWLFAVQGSALAGVQLLVYHDIAARRRGVVTPILVAAAIETVTVLVIAPQHPRGIITIAAGVAVVLVAVTTLLHRRAARRDGPAEDAQCAASSQLRPTPIETSSGTSRA
jgi:O-antigen/teichoic acid export membrane protein